MPEESRPAEAELSQLGRRLRSARLGLGWTQEQLAEKANLHHSYIGQVERGEKVPSLRTLKRLAEAMNTPLDFLLGESPAYTSQTDDLVQELLALTRDCSRQDLELVVAMVRLVLAHLRHRRSVVSGPDEG
ncbi:MAG: helix-turn-helix domain-containing protein [Moorellales bacterium]